MRIRLFQKVKLVIWLIICLTIKTNAQDAAYIKEFVQKIIPPSPTAATMSTFGNLPLNGSSGGFNYNLPLYTIVSGDISLPISLNYYSAGVQVDAVAGVVGMDWNLSAGGAISRVVKDFPDELGYRWYPTSPDWGNSSDEVMLKNLARESGFDGEQDWFSFNVNGISGSFYFDQNLNIHLSSESDISITYEHFQTNPIRFKFTIRDDKGYRYIFGGSDAYIEKNTPLDGCSGETYNNYDSAWYLKQIISPTNNSISFNYTDNDFTYKTSNTFTCSYTAQCPYAELPESFSPTISNCINSSAMQSKLVSAIVFKNNVIMFDYNTNRQDGGGKSLKEIKVIAGSQQVKGITFNYYTYGTASDSPFLNDPTLYYRVFLKDVVFKGNTSSTELEKYAFEYYNADMLPTRLSYNKDKYGFYNGTNNSVAFSNSLQDSPVSSYLGNLLTTANTEVNPLYVYYGMIKKITYPTKGYTEITYEGNADTKTVQVTTPASTQTFNINKSYCSGSDLTLSKTWTSDGTPIKISGNTITNGNTGCTTGNYTIEIKKDNTVIASVTNAFGTPYNTTVGTACTNSFNNYAPICTVSGSNYVITIKLSGGTAAANFTMDYLQPVVTNIEQVFYGPGVRLKSILDMSEGKEYNKRFFYYNKLADIQSSNTTLQHFYEPKFYKELSTYVTSCRLIGSDGEIDNASGWDVKYAALKFSVSSASSYSLSRQTVCYQAITEVLEKDGFKEGCIERVFLPSLESPGYIMTGYEVFDSPSSNFADLTKDKLAEETVYDRSNIKKTKKTYHYNTLFSGYNTSVIVRKLFIAPGEPDWTLPGNAYSTVIRPFSNYSVFLYKNYYGVVKLDTIIEQEFYSNNYVQKLTTKSYGAMPHFQLKSETTTNSIGEVLLTEYKYPNDLIGIEQTPYMQQLTDSLRISNPVIINSYKSGVKLLEKHIKYANNSNTGNRILPIEVHVKKGTGSIDITSGNDRNLQLSRYDSYGNILEYKYEGGVPTSFIWGCNNQYPIVKAENSTYSQISGFASLLQGLSNSGTLVPTSFTSLRSALPSAMLTAYTYIPLIGVSSITDPKGDTVYYDYDSFGRLKSVKDNFGKLLSENEYNYRPQ